MLVKFISSLLVVTNRWHQIALTGLVISCVNFSSHLSYSIEQKMKGQAMALSTAILFIVRPI